MSKRNKTRRLWLQLEVEEVPAGTTRTEVLRTLLRSIGEEEDTRYDLPEGWRINLLWRNKERDEMRGGEWTEEMWRSAVSSDGWDLAVSEYLSRQLRSAQNFKRRQRYRQRKQGLAQA